MSIQPINAQQLYSAQSGAADVVPAPSGQPQSHSQPHLQPNVPAVGDSTSFNKPISTLPLFDKMQSDNSARNEVASSIKSADTSMAEIGKKIDTMKADLEIIVKNFPPYPPGSDDRLKFLRNFNSLRQQIDALTIPRPTDSSAVAVKLHGLNTGPNGINIPALPDTPPEATDRQIYHAINGLDAAKKTLDQSRAGLAGEAATLIANASR